MYCSSIINSHPPGKRSSFHIDKDSGNHFWPARFLQWPYAQNTNEGYTLWQGGKNAIFSQILIDSSNLCSNLQTQIFSNLTQTS